MELVQYVKPEPARVGQRLVIENLDGYFGFREEGSNDFSPFIAVPVGTIFKMNGQTFELTGVEVLSINGCGSSELSKIKLKKALVVFSIPGISDKNADDENSGTKVEHLQKIVSEDAISHE